MSTSGDGEHTAQARETMNEVIHAAEVVVPQPSVLDDVAVVKVESSPSPPGSQPLVSLVSQMNQLGPADRCTPSQAQAMGQQLLAIIALHERSKLSLPIQLQNSFDVFHRCLAVVYGTFFLNLYSKANAPCLLCHGCKSLYPPSQFIHHSCPALPLNIVPCRSRMWRRCLVPLVSPGMDKFQQKQRWKYIIEKFSQATSGGSRRNPIPPDAQAQLLEMPELKRGRFVITPTDSDQGSSEQPVYTKADQLPPLLSSQQQGPDSNHTQNLLDVEPLDCDGDEDSCELPSGGQADDLPTPQQELSVQKTVPGRGRDPPQPHQDLSAISLAEQLVVEVRHLQQDLATTRAKLSTAEDMLRKMPSEAAMREQLAQALATQQVLRVEKEQAVEQCRLAQELAGQLQAQLDSVHATHLEMDKLFTTRS